VETQVNGRVIPQGGSRNFTVAIRKLVTVGDMTVHQMTVAAGIKGGLSGMSLRRMQ
jgi:hypothetical protein